MICYRHANYRTPLRSLASAQRGARYHRGTEAEPTQYLALHPLGPHAEILRNNDLRRPEQALALRLRTWALEISLDDLVEVPFAAALVDDDYEACRLLADRLRAENAPGAVVPSAALPGTQNVVLFGARVAGPYGAPALSAIDVPASITGENGEALVAVQRLVRFRGDRHPGGRFVFEEPSWKLGG